MKALKLWLGVICLAFSMLMAILLLLLAASEEHYNYPKEALLYSLCWFFGSGIFLLVRANAPFSKFLRIGLILNLSLCFAFFVFVTVPSYIRSRSTSSINACVNNLRQIDAAANEFALEHQLKNGAPIQFPSDLTPYIKLDSHGRIPGCPDGGVYRLSRVGDTPTCTLGTTVTPAHVLP